MNEQPILLGVLEFVNRWPEMGVGEQATSAGLLVAGGVELAKRAGLFRPRYSIHAAILSGLAVSAGAEWAHGGDWSAWLSVSLRGLAIAGAAVFDHQALTRIRPAWLYDRPGTSTVPANKPHLRRRMRAPRGITRRRIPVVGGSSE